MSDEQRETVQEREDRVQKAQDDRDKRDEQAPLTGTLTLHDVVRHLVQYGPPADPAARAELLGVVDKDDPSVKNEPKQKQEDSK